MSDFLKRCSVLLLIFFSTEAMGVTSIKLDCPNKFVGEVAQVEDVQGPLSSPHSRKQKVLLKVSKQIEGTLEKDFQEISILKYGPHEFHKGGSYQVSLKDGFLCSAKKVTLN